jgi:diaphanous 1
VKKDEFGLKGDKRTAMYDLSTERKRYLLQQNQQFRSTSGSTSSPNKPLTAASYGPSSGSALIPRLVPQLTGDTGLIRRLSMAGWGSGGTTPASPNASQTNGDFELGESYKTQTEPEIKPLQPQSTGGLWSSWWTSSGGDKGGLEKDQSGKGYSAKWYVDSIRAGRSTDIKLVKHLISLRVHLSTAKLVWIEEFVNLENGMNELGALLAGLVGKGGKKRGLIDVESSVLLEVIKCLRVLLNTEVSNVHFLDL